LRHGREHARAPVDVDTPELREVAGRLDQRGEVDDAVGAVEERREPRARDVRLGQVGPGEPRPRPPAGATSTEPTASSSAAVYWFHLSTSGRATAGDVPLRRFRQIQVESGRAGWVELSTYVSG